MNEQMALWITLFLGGLSAIAWYRGNRYNREKAAWIAGILEKKFSPSETEYTNIGGSIGYHFVYKFHQGQLKEIKGSMIFLPRQALLYLPIAWLLGRRDRVIVEINMDDTWRNFDYQGDDSGFLAFVDNVVKETSCK